MLGLTLATPASAVLAFERSGDAPSYPRHSHVFAARNDGSAPRRIAHGYRPQVSPDGRWVTYFVPRDGVDDLYSVGVHGRQRRLLARNVSWPGGVAWSPDNRHLVVGDADTRGVVLVDVRQGTRHLIRTGEFAGASFAPDGSVFAVDTAVDADFLTAVDTRARTKRYVAHGFSPAWGPQGLAYGYDGYAGPPDPHPTSCSVLLRERPDDPAHVILHEHVSSLRPLGWAADANRLLVMEGPFQTSHAVLIDLSPRRVIHVPTPFSLVAGISTSGRDVLGEKDGDVVSATAQGRVRVLATRATNPSWTK